jgi:hypothetical protein
MQRTLQGPRAVALAARRFQVRDQPPMARIAAIENKGYFGTPPKQLNY